MMHSTYLCNFLYQMLAEQTDRFEIVETNLHVCDHLWRGTRSAKSYERY